MTERDLDWMAGLLEGEGCFTWAPLRGGSTEKMPLIQLVMNDFDVVERYAKLVGNAVGHKPRKPPRKSGYRVRTAGVRAVELMQLLQPLMGQRRQARIAEILSEYYGQRGVDAWGEGKQQAK